MKKIICIRKVHEQIKKNGKNYLYSIGSGSRQENLKRIFIFERTMRKRETKIICIRKDHVQNNYLHSI